MPAVKKRKKAEPVTLNNKSNGKGFFSKNMFIVLAFVIPFVLMTAAFSYPSRFRSYEGFAVR